MIELKDCELKNVYGGGIYYYTLLGCLLGATLTPIGGAFMVGSEGLAEKNFITMRNFMCVLAAIGSTFGLIVGYGIDRNTSA